MRQRKHRQQCQSVLVEPHASVDSCPKLDEEMNDKISLVLVQKLQRSLCGDKRQKYNMQILVSTPRQTHPIDVERTDRSDHAFLSGCCLCV